MTIRPFALERYFAQHEFSAELLLCSSDVESYAQRELLALANSQPGAEPPPAAPVPRWGWGEAPPYTG